MPDTTTYRHTCEVCREYITSRYCETWEEWLAIIDEFDARHEHQVEEE